MQRRVTPSFFDPRRNKKDGLQPCEQGYRPSLKTIV